jgi:molybdopterin-guanine dinucleotide biosynthesis protein
MPRPRPAIIGIGGFESNVGKTTLMCELLKAFPGREAIKTTRGHYRSCGKDPHACCVSHLLSDQPTVRSGREETYVAGKDTGRYWDAGASNVHWVIATEEQVEIGIKEALKRVGSNSVFIEGNTFSEFVDVDLMVMVTRANGEKIKKSARQALLNSSLLYLSGETTSESRELFYESQRSYGIGGCYGNLPVYGSHDFSQLVTEVQQAISRLAAWGFQSQTSTLRRLE